MFYQHETSVIDNDVIIGNGTNVWHFCHISSGAEIGENCILGQNVYIGPKVKIGNNVKIQNNVSLYEGIVVENDVFCGPSVVFTNVKNPRSEINRKGGFLTTRIKRGATLGANSTIVCGNVVGEYAFIAAGAVIVKSVKDFALVAGVPAKQIGWISKAGHRLLFESPVSSICIDELGDKYILQNGAVRVFE